ncbi:MAG: hypothetical protein DMF81_25405, partial [Acidobacteria bacterium]
MERRPSEGRRHQVRPGPARHLRRDGRPVRSRALRSRPAEGHPPLGDPGHRRGDEGSEAGCAALPRRLGSGDRGQAGLPDGDRALRARAERSGCPVPTGPAVPRGLRREAGAARRELHGPGLQRAPADRAGVRLRAGHEAPGASTVDAVTVRSGGVMHDYVIVGAGSAGCVLANRLTEDPRTTVVLLEAGPSDRHLYVHVPAATVKLFKTERDWNYATEPQAQAAGRTLYWPRGKMLGGSSSMNYSMYVRGHRADYDAWAGRGNPGWGFEDVVPYFKRGERNQRGASAYHGHQGPLWVSDLRSVNPLTQAFVAGGAAVGLTQNPDVGGAEPEGIGLTQVTQKKGRRCSA